MARSDIGIGLTLGDLDNDGFLRAIGSPLGMYLKLLAWAWRSPVPPDHHRAPPLHRFYAAGFLTSWAMDGTLADVFEVKQRTIINWRAWLRDRGLLAICGTRGKPLVYLLGRWSQKTNDHWQVRFVWEGWTDRDMKDFSELDMKDFSYLDMKDFSYRKIEPKEVLTIESTACMHADMKPITSQLEAWGIDRRVVGQLLSEYEPPYLLQKVRYTLHRAKSTGDGFNPAGYLIAALRDDYNPPAGYNEADYLTHEEQVQRYLGIGTDYEGLVIS